MKAITRIRLLTAALLVVGTAGGWAKDDASLGITTVQSLLKQNPSLSAEDATVQALKELRKKTAARAGATEEGLAQVWQQSPARLKTASLKIMQADPQVAGYVVRTAGSLDRALNQELMIAAAKTNPEFLGFAVQAACNNDPSRYRELALAADAAVPGHSLDVIGGVMGARCETSRGICWHYAELEKRTSIDVAAVLEEAVKWEAAAEVVVRQHGQATAPAAATAKR